jgi:HSP20 family molecular chaperone IbpA
MSNASPFDILVKNFFEQDSTFDKLNHRSLNHPVDIWEDDEGLCLEVACVGLTKTDIDVDIEDDILKVSYNKKDSIDESAHYHYRGVKKSSFDLGWKIARRFDLTKANANMENGLLKILVPISKAAKPKSLKIQ